MYSTPMRALSLCAVVLTAALPLTIAAQSTPTPITRESLAGTYNGGQMEVGAELVLKPNGHFTYELAYGALDESAEGTWDFKDGAVFLTTVPAVDPPRFVVVSDTPDPNPGLWIKLTPHPIMEGARQRVFLLYQPIVAGAPVTQANQPDMDMAEVADDGHVPLPGNRRPVAIIPEIPVYPIMAAPIPLTGTGGHHFVLRFDPNGIGKADFRSTRLAIEDGVLVMPRRDLGLILHFKR
jgi:hypothetical protein